MAQATCYFGHSLFQIAIANAPPLHPEYENGFLAASEYRCHDSALIDKF